MIVLIVENEPLPADQLKDFTRKAAPGTVFLPYATTIRDTVHLLHIHTPDLIFMDIELSDGNAFNIFRETEVKAPVIFTTAFNQHFMSAFEKNGINYLVKPITQDRVNNALKNFASKQSIAVSTALPGILSELFEQQQQRTGKTHFLVKQGQKLIPVRISDINHFCSENTLVYLVTRDKRKYVVSESLSELENMLNPDEFFRMNRKFIIAKTAIHSLDYYSRGQVAINANLLEQEHIIVSRQQTPQLKDWLIR